MFTMLQLLLFSRKYKLPGLVGRWGVERNTPHRNVCIKSDTVSSINVIYIYNQYLDIENTTRVPVGDDLSYNEWFLKRT